MKFIIKLNWILLLGLMILVAACNAPPAIDSSEKEEVERELNESKAAVSIEDSYWKIVKIKGKDVIREENMQKEMHFMLYSKDNRVSGFLGCNSFFGVYKLKEGMRIKFNGLGSTKKSCPNIKVSEQELLNVFGLADNYSIKGNLLSLYVGKRGPLAIFEFVEMN